MYMRKLLLAAGFGVLLILAIGGLLKDGGSDDTTFTPSQPIKTTTQPSFNMQAHSLTDPTSIWVVVNKQRPLSPKEYIPADLGGTGVAMRNGTIQVRAEVAAALQAMFAAAEKNKTALRVSSGYRSYNYQVGLYNGYVNKEGQVAADAESARPGYSEHQTGLAADIGPFYEHCNVEACFADTPEGKWLAAESYKYGFIIRYPDGKQAITGYNYEPWHVRYVGATLATEMHNRGIQTIEEFFTLGAASNY